MTTDEQPAERLRPPEWVTRWLSASRFDTYLAAAAGNPDQALALYEWNTELSSAMLHDLCHLEVGLRNAYNAALESHGAFPKHWTRCGRDVFAPVHRSKKRFDPATGRRVKVRVDINEKPRQSLDRAIREAGGPGAPAGKVVAQLMFGFWRYLSSAAHEITLWRPYLHRAFAAGTSRTFVETRIAPLHDIRNRVAHHESLLAEDIDRHHARLIELASAIAPELAAHIGSTSRVPSLSASKPA